MLSELSQAGVKELTAHLLLTLFFYRGYICKSYIPRHHSINFSLHPRLPSLFLYVSRCFRKVRIATTRSRPTHTNTNQTTLPTYPKKKNYSRTTIRQLHIIIPPWLAIQPLFTR